MTEKKLKKLVLEQIKEAVELLGGDLEKILPIVMKCARIKKIGRSEFLFFVDESGEPHWSILPGQDYMTGWQFINMLYETEHYKGLFKCRIGENLTKEQIRHFNNGQRYRLQKLGIYL